MVITSPPILVVDYLSCIQKSSCSFLVEDEHEKENEARMNIDNYFSSSPLIA
jgi:hypothetical protein